MYKNHLIEAAINLGLTDPNQFYSINDEHTEIISSDESTTIPVTDAVISRAKYLAKIHEIREVRGNLLKDTDWVVLSDVDLDAATKQQWLDYRQALRDCTGDVIEGQEDEFTYPTSPLAGGN